MWSAVKPRSQIFFGANGSCRYHDEKQNEPKRQLVCVPIGASESHLTNLQCVRGPHASAIGT